MSRSHRPPRTTGGFGIAFLASSLAPLFGLLADGHCPPPPPRCPCTLPCHRHAAQARGLGLAPLPRPPSAVVAPLRHAASAAAAISAATGIVCRTAVSAAADPEVDADAIVAAGSLAAMHMEAIASGKAAVGGLEAGQARGRPKAQRHWT